MERDSFIREYFAETYKKVPEHAMAQSINQFLGNVAEHLDVLSSKLNHDERESLERELTIDEFDNAIDKAKLNPLRPTRRWTDAHFCRFFTVLEYSPIGENFCRPSHHAPCTMFRKKNWKIFKTFLF
jgi:hypothetical protein